MGLFSLIKGAMGGNRVMINSSLGNVLITGNSPRGSETIMRNYAIDTINRGGAVVIFRDSKNGFSAYSSVVNQHAMVCEINNEEGVASEAVDILSCFSDSECNQYIINMFDKYSEVEKSKRMSYQNYIALIRNLLKKRGRQIKLKDLENYSIEDIEDLNASLSMPEMERNRNERFLNSIRPDIRELEAYFYDFSNNSVGAILSGNKTLEKILSTKVVVEVSLDFVSKPNESEIIMAAMIDGICKMNCSAAGRSFVSVIVNEVPNECLIDSGLNKLIKSTGNCNVLYTVADISNLIEKSNEWIEYADSYFFFKQNSNKNKEFCSEFFGTYEKTKVSKTYNAPTFWSAVQGNTSATKGNTTTTEKERVYLPDVFANLMENQAIYYFKKKNEHSRLTVY